MCGPGAGVDDSVSGAVKVTPDARGNSDGARTAPSFDRRREGCDPGRHQPHRVNVNDRLGR